MTSIRPNKRLGQNFLTDKKVLAKILNAAGLTKRDLVVEIGPGLGVLTKALSQKAKRVIAIEKDGRLVGMLEGLTVGMKNIKVVYADILKLKHSGIPTFQHSYKVVANLPYYITSPVIRKFLEAKHKPKLMVLMVQKEVAQRICAKPPRMSLLAVSVQFYGEPKIVSYVKRTSFWPQPKVDSAILRIVPKSLAELSYPHLNRVKFFMVVKAGFKQPRKQLANNLAKGLGVKMEVVEEWLTENNLNPTQRAETLSLEDWARLAKSTIF